MDFDVKIIGLKEVTETLKQLPDKIQQGAIRAGLRAGANIIKEEAKKRVRVKGQYQPNVTLREAHTIISRVYETEAYRSDYLEKHLERKASRERRAELSRSEISRIEKVERQSQFIRDMEMWFSPPAKGWTAEQISEYEQNKWDPFLRRNWQKFVRTHLNKPRTKLP